MTPVSERKQMQGKNVPGHDEIGDAWALGTKNSK